MTRAPSNTFAALLFALALATTAPGALAQSPDGDAGTGGYKFLQNHSDARSAALAGASSALPGRPGSAATNPALLAEIDGIAALGTHSERIATIRQEYVELAVPRWGGVLSASVRTQSIGDIPMRTVDDRSTLDGVPSVTPFGTYGVYNAAIGLAYARQAYGLLWGVGGKVVTEKIYLYSARAVALDFGALWRSDAWRVGAAVRNLGVSGKLRNEETPIAWDAVVGASYSRTVNGMLLRGLADVRYAPDWYETVHVGAEVHVTCALVLRTGYRRALASNTELDGLTAGAGLAAGPVGIDYAYIPTDTGLGAEHLFSLTLTQ